jgi:hypothetical protein
MATQDQADRVVPAKFDLALPSDPDDRTAVDRACKSK